MVAYWFVEQFQLTRDNFRIVAIFNDEAGARAYAAEHTAEREPCVVDGVTSIEQLVDMLIMDRYYPLSNLLAEELSQRRSAVRKETSVNAATDQA